MFRGEPRRFLQGHYQCTKPREVLRNEYRRLWQKERPHTPYGNCWCGCGEKTKIAPKTIARLPVAKGEPLRYLTGHQTRKAPFAYISQDFGYNTECWVWQWCINKDGYGAVWDGTTMIGAHRHYYELHRGSIPPGMQIDHLCRIRACVNPDHLEVVTKVENNHRGNATKLTSRKVEDIRTALDRDILTRQELADEHNVTRGTIDHIARRYSWTS